MIMIKHIHDFLTPAQFKILGLRAITGCFFYDPYPSIVIGASTTTDTADEYECVSAQLLWPRAAEMLKLCLLVLVEFQLQLYAFVMPLRFLTVTCINSKKL